jgi:2,3-bisphosphoglycerate-independent phosphoglycerate mutase
MKPVLLVVIDGVGLRKQTEGNAFKQADTPNLGKLMARQGFTKLEASGPAVGLPQGYTGNSEVGHLHLGAGRKIPQRLTRINQSIENQELRQKEPLKNALETAEKENQTVHLAGIISDGGIHGHIQHLKALLKISSNYNVEIKIHCFTDGRDVPPKSAEKYLNQIQKWAEKHGGEIATIIGRYYSMDRDHNWDRTRKAYQAITQAQGYNFSKPEEALEKTYEQDDYDYFIQPSTSEKYEGMNQDDQVIFYNFRADRERQITQALIQKDFKHFNTPIKPDFISMFPYKKDFQNPALFEKNVVENTLGEKIQENGLSQLRVAESQKKPHVTYFFNGQRELKFENEERKFIESDKIKAYDQKPEMHAEEITGIVLDALEEGEKDFILLNYANCDLVGHTGDLDAAKKAVETVDQQIGKLIEKTKQKDYALIITADHGNCENMGTQKKPNTSHTNNKIPLITLNTQKEYNFKQKQIWETQKLIQKNLEIQQ